MKIIRFALFFGIICFTQNFSFGQLSKKALNIVGKWEYKEGSGFEVWKLDKEELKGEAFRLNKVGATSKVEDLHIKSVNKTLIHTITTYNFVIDSTTLTTYRFVSASKKLEFVNIDANTPYSIQYKFGFFNKDKLMIRIKYGANSEKSELILFRVEDSNVESKE